MFEEERLREIKGLLKDMIRNKCVNPPGNELRSIRRLKEKKAPLLPLTPEVFWSIQTSLQLSR